MVFDLRRKIEGSSAVGISWRSEDIITIMILGRCFIYKSTSMSSFVSLNKIAVIS